MGFNPFAATKGNIFTNGEAGCYSGCVELPTPRCKCDSIASRKMCCLLHDDSTATVVTDRAHTIYTNTYVNYTIANKTYNVYM